MVVWRVRAPGVWVPLVPLTPLLPWSALKYAVFSPLVGSTVSLRLMPFDLIGLDGFEVTPLRSSSLILLSWWCKDAEPFTRPALSGCHGWGVCGRESSV